MEAAVLNFFFYMVVPKECQNNLNLQCFKCQTTHKTALDNSASMHLMTAPVLVTKVCFNIGLTSKQIPNPYITPWKNSKISSLMAVLALKIVPYCTFHTQKWLFISILVLACHTTNCYWLNKMLLTQVKWSSPSLDAICESNNGSFHWRLLLWLLPFVMVQQLEEDCYI